MSGSLGEREMLWEHEPQAAEFAGCVWTEPYQEKKVRIQKHPDTCGQGLRTLLRPPPIPSLESLVTVMRPQVKHTYVCKMYNFQNACLIFVSFTQNQACQGDQERSEAYIVNTEYL